MHIIIIIMACYCYSLSNRSYEKWISKLMVDVRASHDREVHITEQLKSSFNDSFSIVRILCAS